MVIQKINIERVLHEDDDLYSFKERCPVKKKMRLDLIKSNGQIYPLVGYFYKEQFVIIEGKIDFECLKELEYSEVYVNDVGFKSPLEHVSLSYLLTESVRDVDSLKLAVLIDYLSSGYTDVQLSEKLGMKLNQILVLKDILKLDFVVTSQKDNSQQILFED